ncbi:MAG: hypothetical protein ACI9JN_000960 [Bacteroidia bacterium]|jgi:hypothetical protein
MKTNRLVLIAAALICSVAVQAQDDVRGLKWNDNTSQVDVVTMNPDNPNDVTVINSLILGNDRMYTPNTLTHVAETKLMYFFTQSFNGFIRGETLSQQLVVANAETGEILRSLPIQRTTLIAPFIIPEKNQIGFIATERTHNSYGNNDDRIALVIFDINSGEIAHRIELPSLSLSALATPFIGTTSNSNTPNGNGGATKTAVSVSSPCYISASQTLLFAAKDVMGINRMYRFNINTGRLVTKLAIDVDVLDMAYDDLNATVKTLYLKETSGERGLYIGKMSVNGSEIINEVLIRTLGADEITDGQIEIDPKTSICTVVKNMNDVQVFYTFDAELTLTATNALKTKSEQIDFEFATPLRSNNQFDFASLVSMYPNPATADLTIESINDNKVNRITIFDNLGQEVKDVDVQSNELSNSIDISSLKLGLYTVQIESSGVTTITKKLIVQ